MYNLEYNIPEPTDWSTVISDTMIDTMPSRSGISFVHNSYREADILFDHMEKCFHVPESPSTPFKMHPFWKNAWR